MDLWFISLSAIVLALTIKGIKSYFTGPKDPIGTYLNEESFQSMKRSLFRQGDVRYSRD